METQLNVPRTFVVVGGGIGGVCCVEELQRVCSPGDTIILVSASSILKVCELVTGAHAYTAHGGDTHGTCLLTSGPGCCTASCWPCGVLAVSACVHWHSS